MKIIAFILAMVVIMSSLFAGSVIGKTNGKLPTVLKIAYVYGADTSKNTNWTNYFTSCGYTSEVCAAGSVVGFDFSTANLIIIGTNTSSDWNTVANVNAIKQAGKPILGIGEGGSEYFFKVGLTINWNNCAYNNANMIYAENTTSSLYTTPNSITVPANKIVYVYPASSSFAVLQVYIPILTANDTVFGNNTGGSSKYSLISAEMNPGKPVSMLWSYETISPSELITTGQHLLQNTIVYCALTVVVPELPSISFASLGLMALFIIVLTVRLRRNKH